MKLWAVWGYYDVRQELRGIVCGMKNIEIYEGTKNEAIKYARRLANDGVVYSCIGLDTSKLPTLDIKELEEMYYHDEGGFIEAYKLD